MAGVGERVVSPTTPPPGVAAVAPPRRGERAGLYAIVLVGGVASVGTQIAASRLVAPYFGNATDIWATLIGLTLTYLSAGYYLGGKLADRYPSVALLCALTVIAAGGIGLIPSLAPPLLGAALGLVGDRSGGALYGAFAAVAVLFLVPITLLGALSPLAIRLRVRGVGEAGTAAGTIYALSTLGSIAGSFVPVLILLPSWGTRATLYAFALALGGVALLAFMLARPMAPPTATPPAGP